MKKNIALLIVVVSLLSFGVAFAADRQGAGETGRLMNGVTYSDPGPASTCGDADAAFAREASTMPFNGITFFDLGQPGSGAKGSCAGQRTKESMMKDFNGITFFSTGTHAL